MNARAPLPHTALAAMAVLVIVADLVARFAPPLVALGACIVIPVALLPRWSRLARTQHWGWFRYAKLLLVPAGAMILVSLRRMPAPAPVALEAVVTALLGVNILAAVLLEWSAGERLNVLAGVLVLAAMPWVGPLVPGTHGVAAPLGWPFILAYTAWNLALFARLAGGVQLGIHSIVLGVALLAALVLGSEQWLFTRATTLTALIWVLYSLVPPPVSPEAIAADPFGTPGLVDAKLVERLSKLAITLAIVAIFSRCFRM